MQLFEENLDAWIELNLCIFLKNASESDARACSDYNLLVINRSKWLFDSANTRRPAGIWVLMGFNLEFLSAADRRRRRRCMSGNVRPSVRPSVCLSVRPTSFATFDHFPEVRSMRNRYGWCILLQATFRHRFHGWMISRFSVAVQKLVIFSYFFTFLRTPPTFLIEGC